MPTLRGGEVAKSDFSSRTKRLELPRAADATETVSAGLYLIYRRGKGAQAGTWRARRRKTGSTSYDSTSLGVADDLLDANGKDVVSYDQAVAAARRWADSADKNAAKSAAMGTPAGDLFCDEVFDHYLQDLRDRGRPTDTAVGILKAHIRPRWGRTRISGLAKAPIKAWLVELAEAPRRRTGQRFSAAGTWGDDGPTDDQRRARRVTANRIFAVFTAAMNLAAKEGLIVDDPAPWRAVHQFAKVKKSRLRFLVVEEQRQLVAACGADYTLLVEGALHTGSRLGPLVRLEARDLNEKAGTLFIEKDKNEGARHIVLAPEGLRFFRKLVKSKRPSDLLFRRADGAVWTKEMSQDLIREACLEAGIEPLTFHELRHTYASGLVNAGVPLAFVAKQLGHKDTRMVEQHYGHLAPTAVAESIRTLTPTLGLGRKRR